MKWNYILGAILAIFVIAGAGCASLDSMRHQYIMRGQVLEAEGSDVYLCIGSKDGAEVGQEFVVYRFVKSGRRYPSVLKENKGTVKIIEIIDEHYAKAKVLAGDVKVNDVVELKSVTQESGHQHH